MKTFFVLLALSLGLTLGFAAEPAGSADVPRGQVDRVMANIEAEVFFGPSIFNGFRWQLVGVAHIQAHAYDIDPAGIVNPFAQSADVGWVSCDPIGSLQCAWTANGGARTNIWSVSFQSDLELNVSALIIYGSGSRTLIMSLVDGGTPGNGLRETDFGFGMTPTIDWIGMEAFFGGPSLFARVLGGNVTINRDGL